MRKGRIIISYGYGVICMETMWKTCKYLGQTISELRFKTGNYEIWSPPIFTNFLLVISHKYITTYFLSGVSCGGYSGASHNFLTHNPHMLHHSQAVMHNFCVESTHLSVSLTQITGHHCWTTGISWNFIPKYPCSPRQRKKRDPNKTLTVLQYLFIQNWYFSDNYFAIMRET